MNGQSKWDMWCDAIDQVMRETGLTSRMDAAEIAKERFPHLVSETYRKYPAGAGSDRQASSHSGSGGGAQTAEQELDRRAKEVAARDRITYAKAYVQVLNGDANLYLRYLQEKQVELARSHRG